MMLCENADHDAQRDMETYMQHIVFDSAPMFLRQDRRA